MVLAIAARPVRADDQPWANGVTGDLLAHCVDTALWLNGPMHTVNAMQETFVKAWSSAQMFDAVRGSEAAWLISIARSRGIDRLRSRKVRSERENDAGREISHRSAFVESGMFYSRATSVEAMRTRVYQRS